MSRVAITGLSMTSCLGLELSSNWNFICAGLSGLSLSTLPHTKLFGPIKEGLSSEFAESYMSLTHTPHATKSIITVIETLNNSHFHPNTEEQRSQMALSESFQIPDGHQTYLKTGTFTASNISKALGYTGPVTTSASGIQSIVEACQLIRNNEVKSAIAFGSSVDVDEYLLKSLHEQGLLSESEEYQMLKGQKLILGEGSAGILLENLDHALERGAKIYAEVEMHSCTDATEECEMKFGGELVVGCGSGIEQFDRCEQKWLEGTRFVNFKGNYGWVANADGINDTVMAALIIGQGVIPPVIGKGFKIERERLNKVSVLGFGMDGSAWGLELVRFEGK